MKFILPVLGELCKYSVVCHIWSKLAQGDINLLCKTYKYFEQNSPVFYGLHLVPHNCGLQVVFENFCRYNWTGYREFQILSPN